MPRYRVRRAADVTRDLDLIEEHLVQVYQELGDGLETAADRASDRIDQALAYMRTFALHPHRGTEHPIRHSDRDQQEFRLLLRDR